MASVKNAYQIAIAPEELGDHVVTLIGRTLSLWRQLVHAMRRIMCKYVACCS
jgi:hypothetical protein